MSCTVKQALDQMSGVKKVRERLQVLYDLGLGYLTLGEATPALSGGEAQRLKIASEMGKSQEDAVFIFDEPTIGLHPLDTRVLIQVFQNLIDHGATVIVIEHDLDMIANADCTKPLARRLAPGTCFHHFFNNSLKKVAVFEDMLYC